MLEMSFSSLPVLDLSLSNEPDSKPAFLDSLRKALLEVGFFYISNTGIDDSLIQDVITQGKAFFDLPEEKKLEIQMKKVPSFLGYNKLGNEITAHAIDWREQIDISTPHPLPALGAPLYRNLLAPNQWPDPSFLPHFRPVYESYIRQVASLSTRFTSLIAEALHMPPTAFDRFFDADQQHKLKIVKYPDTTALPLNRDDNSLRNRSAVSSSRTQGVGPHKDSMLTSYLLQASPHRGLQAQNLSGEWIDCPPLASTLVVAIGQSLEALTDGVCSSTTHRVLSPLPGSGPRFSVPFFQGVSIDASIDDAVLDVPAEILAMRDELIKQRGGLRKDDVEFQFKKGGGKCHGEVTLWNRCKSHPDVAEAWYPEILAKVKEEAERKGLQLGSAY